MASRPLMQGLVRARGAGSRGFPLANAGAHVTQENVLERRLLALQPVQLPATGNGPRYLCLDAVARFNLALDVMRRSAARQQLNLDGIDTFDREQFLAQRISRRSRLQNDAVGLFGRLLQPARRV